MHASSAARETAAAGGRHWGMVVGSGWRSLWPGQRLISVSALWMTVLRLFVFIYARTFLQAFGNRRWMP
jgi:predicted amidohydrolase YtcJ